MGWMRRLRALGDINYIKLLVLSNLEPFTPVGFCFLCVIRVFRGCLLLIECSLDVVHGAAKDASGSAMAYDQIGALRGVVSVLFVWGICEAPTLPQYRRRRDRTIASLV